MSTAITKYFQGKGYTECLGKFFDGGFPYPWNNAKVFVGQDILNRSLFIDYDHHSFTVTEISGVVVEYYEFEALFSSIGLDKSNIRNILNNKKLSHILADCICDAKVDKWNRVLANHVLEVATKLPERCTKLRPLILSYIVENKITLTQQFDSLFKYCNKLPQQTTEINLSDFEKACGVGIHVDENQINVTIEAILKENEYELQKERYAAPLFSYFYLLRERLPWANGSSLKMLFDAAIFSRLGLETEEDKEKKKTKGKASKKEKEINAGNKSKVQKQSKERVDQPSSNPSSTIFEELLVARPLDAAMNSPEVLERHNLLTGGCLITRFPPEPNGYLHIGHAKSQWFNFGLASKHNGKCILRFDDTNPEKEDTEYIKSIIENVKWLGHSPFAVTYSSDYFPQLYQIAIDLIKKGYCYVCHQTPNEIKESRAAKEPEKRNSPWRNRTVEENLRLFEDMRRGKFEEGAAILRVKGDMMHPQPCMWDFVAYRIKYSPHPRTGVCWCIYPSYDFTHCLCDSLEHVTHSVCTLGIMNFIPNITQKFETRRESYYWLLDVAGLFKPCVWEFSRLNLEHTIMSKRKLQMLVNSSYVDGWDDPRMPTIDGLRRRGYTPVAINHFCELVGISRNENLIRYEVLEHCAREDLDRTSPRVMAILNPIKIILDNVPDDFERTISAPQFPKDPSKGMFSYTLTKILFVERDDFREKDDPNYFGLGDTELHCTIDLEIHPKEDSSFSRASSTALPATIYIYDFLFVDREPPEGDNWLDSFNQNSKQECKGLIPFFLKDEECKRITSFQFERLGYFVVDTSSTTNNQVFNRVVTLREDKDKKLIDLFKS